MPLNASGVILKIYDKMTNKLLVARPCSNQAAAMTFFKTYQRDPSNRGRDLYYDCRPMPPRI